MSILQEYLRFNLHGILSVGAGVLSIVIGSTVFFKAKSSLVNRAYFLFSINMAFWTIGFGMVSLVRKFEDVTIWTGVAHSFGVPYIAVSTYLFFTRFVGERENKKILIGGFIWAFLTSAIIILFRSDVSVINTFSWGRYTCWHLNPISILHVVSLVSGFYFFSLFGFLKLVKAWKNSIDDEEKKSFQNVLIAFVIAYSGSVDYLTGFGLNIYPFGYISLTCFNLVIAYNMVKHQFLDIKIVVKKASLLAGIYLLLSIVVVFSSKPFIMKIVASDKADIHGLVWGLGMLIGGILSLGPLIYAGLIKNSYWLRGQLSTGFTHELKSPLSAIHGAIEILSLQLNSKIVDREKLGEYVSMIQKNTTRLSGYVNDLLAISKIQDGIVQVDRAELDLSEILQKEVEAYTDLAEIKKLRISTNIQDGVRIWGDRKKLVQVFSNIIGNAIKFSNSGEIKVSLVIIGNHIRCEIDDQGIGIRQRDLGKIFDRFYQAHKVSGSGIGLTIAKAWVEAHGGKIWVHSMENKGTCVSLQLLPITKHNNH